MGVRFEIALGLIDLDDMYVNMQLRDMVGVRAGMPITL